MRTKAGNRTIDNRLLLFESQLELKVVQYCKKHGFLCIKFVPVASGMPDRIIIKSAIRYKHYVKFLELKRSEHAKIRVSQMFIASILRGMGIPVLISHDFEKIKQFIEDDV